MISSIFGKTKPINYIILLTFLFLFYWFVHFFVFKINFTFETLVLKTMALATLFGCIFLVNFSVKNNKVTENNSFAILYFTLFAIVFPETLIDFKGIFCSFFLLLAMQRLIGVRSLKNIKPKIFDATLWVVVSSLFYDWALLYLILVFATIYIYEPKNLKNWLVPITGLVTTFLIGYAVLIMMGNTAFLNVHYNFGFNFDKNYFLNLANSSKLVLYILLILVLAVFAFLKLGKAGLGKIVTMRVIALSFIIGIAVKVLSTSTDEYPVMITFFPAAIFITNYIEAVNKPIFKEILLITSVVMPLLVLLIGMLVR